MSPINPLTPARLTDVSGGEAPDDRLNASGHGRNGSTDLPLDVNDVSESPSTVEDSQPIIIPRSEHGISRANISDKALKVLYRLQDAGFEAYLVGGGVRDLLLGREPKDFDVATDARPEQVKEVFRNCRLIGRRFRLAHVYFGPEIIEVATFRGDTPEADSEGDLRVDAEQGHLLRDNVFGTLEEDACRRDFTINALYYTVADFSVRDFVHGLPDLRAGLIRTIGDPARRYREDPVRMVRAIRFAAKLGFRLAPETEAPILEHAHRLTHVPPARLFEETLKLFMNGHGLSSFEELRRQHVFEHLFPATEESLTRESDHFPRQLIHHALADTDTRVTEGKSVTPSFLFAALLWDPVRERAAQVQNEQQVGAHEAFQIASHEIMVRQARHTALPKRFSLPMREIWGLQPRFRHRAGKRAERLLGHPRFRAAYDFLCLRARAGEDVEADCQWWTALQEKGGAAQKHALYPKGKSRRRRGKSRNSSTEEATGDSEHLEQP